MKRLGSVAAVILAAVLLVCVPAVPAQAAPSRTYAVSNSALHTQAVDERMLELERKYDIDIEYPTFERYGTEIAAIYPATLDTLDTAFTAVTPALVQKVSAHCREQTGNRLSVAYVYADLRGPYGASASRDITVGLYDVDHARIEIYIPREGQGAVATGDNILTVTHELGHAVHAMLTDLYGYEQMESEWRELLDGHDFGKGQIDRRIFITAYASTSFDEDFAETFAHVFACNRPGLGFSGLLTEEAGENMSVLGRKVAYIDYLLTEQLTGINTALRNYRKIHETPNSLNYKGIKLSGFHLVSINMAEPRSIPLMLVTLLRVDEAQTVWISEIGGWYTTDLFGNHLCLFPDGTWGNAGRNMLAA